MKKEIQNKIASCKALQGMTVADVIATVRFRDNLEKYINAQREDRKSVQSSYEAMKKMGGAKGYKLPAHVIDRVSDLSTEEFAQEYARVLSGKSTRSAAERRYIIQLGQQAYNVTIGQYVCEEFPEMESVFFPKVKAN